MFGASPFVAACSAWTEALLARLAGRDLPAPADVPASELLADLVQRFRLSPVDKKVLELALGVERSLAAGRLVREVSGRGGLTVELVRAALGPEAEAALGGRGALRVHGLVAVAAAPGGVPEPGAGVRLAPGMAARLAGQPVAADALGHGVETVAGRSRPQLGESLAAALRDHLVGVAPSWVTIVNARPGDAAQLAEGLAHRLQRSVVLVDGRTVGAAWDLLAAVRRECDLAGAPLLVDAVGALGAAWRALAAPAPEGGRGRPVVLVNPDAPVPRAPAGFESHAVAFVVAPAPPPPPDPTPVAELNAIEAAKHKAAEDVARMLGRPVPGKDHPIRAAIPRPAEGAPAPAPSPKVTVAAPPPPKEPPPAPKEPPPKITVAAPPPPPPAPKEPPPKITVAAAPPTPSPSPTPTPSPSPTPPPNPPPAPDAAVSAVPDGPPDPAESLPYLDVPEEADRNALIVLCYQVKNPKQRAELIVRIVALGKDVQTLKLLRTFATMPHAAVRAAAEEGLAKLFGASWSAKREIPKPVQPPRSED